MKTTCYPLSHWTRPLRGVPRLNLFTFCLLLLGLLRTPSQAVVWIERHGISGATLQNEFDLWTAAPFRYRMTKVSGSETSGAARYAVIFEQSTKTTPWAARNGMTATEFADYHNSIHPLGYRLVWLDGFGVGTTAYYNGIWEDTNGPAQRLRLGETLAAHQSADATNNNAGYYLTDVCSFSVNGSPFHAGVWGTARSGALEVKYSLTGAGYQTEFNNMGAAGYHLHRVCGYVSAGTDRYTGVWRTNSVGEGWSYHGMGAGFFTAEMNNTQTTGYRPVFIDAWNNTAGDTVYNATWVRNGGLSTSRLGDISTAVSNYMSANNLPGLSLAIAREGRLVYARGFGYADTSAGEFAHSLHRWRIASTSKTIAAVSALRALEDSASWSLDSRAFGSGALFGTDFGTQAYSTWETQMTLRQMMNMTCGWQSQGRLWYESWPAYGTNHGSIIGYQLDSVSVATEPGTRYCYNNTNYQVVARIPEKISGQTFAAYTAQEVFTPCGITSMALGGRTAADQLSNEVAYYPGDVYGSPETVWPSRMDGSTGWITKPSDLLLLARRIDGNARHTDIIGSYALSQMQLGNMQPDVHNGGTSGYGLGWYSSTRHGLTWWQHNGSMAGTQAILCVSGDGSQAFAYATNSVSNADAFSGTIRNTVLDLMDQINDANAWPAIDLSGKYNPAYDTWASSAFGTGAVTRTGVLPVWAPGSDPDNDGRCNALEAYLGSNPNDPEASPFSVFVTGGKLVLRWRKNNGYRGVEVTPEWSSSMQTWLRSGTELVDRTDLITIIGTTIQEARIPAPAGVSKRYIRLSLSAP